MSNTTTIDVSVIENTVGLLQLGGFANSILYGVNCVQAFTFYQQAQEREDGAPIKLLVAALWIINSLHVAFNVTTLDFYLVKSFSNVAALSNTHWSLACDTLLTMVSNFFVRIFFAYRIWIISRGSYWITLPVAVLSALGFGFGMTFTVESFLHTTFAAMHSFAWLVYVPLAVASLSDICMTSALCYFLYTNRTGIRRTDSIINILMMYCINASLLTTCLNIICFVTFLALPKSYIFMAIFFVSSKLYFCSLLATLNAREMLRHKSNAVSLPTLRATRHPQRRSTELGFATNKDGDPITISVGTDSHTHVNSAGGLTDSKGSGSGAGTSTTLTVRSRSSSCGSQDGRV